LGSSGDGYPNRWVSGSVGSRNRATGSRCQGIDDLDLAWGIEVEGAYVHLGHQLPLPLLLVVLGDLHGDLLFKANFLALSLLSDPGLLQGLASRFELRYRRICTDGSAKRI
jgi:hypothetical protein